MQAAAVSWSVLAVSVGGQGARSLALCPDCMRALRLFLLGAPAAASDRAWNALIFSVASGGAE